MQPKLTLTEIKTHSRKEIVSWVQSSGEFKYEHLKNGLFFFRILKKLLPGDQTKYKSYEKPKNEYEFTHNLNIVKRILNKAGLQMNMNVADIVSSKNCFDLTNWFKNLYDQNKADGDNEFQYSEKSYTPSKLGVTSYKSPAAKAISRATSSDIKKGDKRYLMQITGPLHIPKKSGDVLSKKYTSQRTVFIPNLSIQSMQKQDIGIYSSGSKLMARKEAASLASQKRQKIFVNRTSAQLPIYLDETEIMQEEEGTEIMDIDSLLKKEALLQNIQSFEKIIHSLQNFIQQIDQNILLSEFHKKIRDIIYMKQ